MTTPETFEIAVPSGQVIRFLDVVTDAPGPDGPTVRYRFLAPAIARLGGSVDFDTAAADMLHLCQSYVLPLLDQSLPPSQIVISLSDRPVPFGEAAPDATQFFEAYRLEDGRCIWEAF
ncbi:DUF6497 family protein [Cypionkella sp.]|jgi:hypothetical protein|uniref:DUF6497 family protein n=1 Tax=Cypionkella sp. TaxID=2811411 RepID=UPI002FDCF6A7